jgi:hypothetical protein
MVYLKQKPKTDYSGIESYVSQHLQAADISWFPLHRAISINAKVEENENI